MRYIEKQKSGATGTDVAVIKISKEEIKLLHDLVKQSHQNTPKVFETLQFRGRLRNLERGFGDCLKELDWTPLNHEPMKKREY